MDTTKNVINWFEIPVDEFERARRFYEAIFEIEMKVMDMGGARMGFFHFEPGSGVVGGAICQGEGYLVSHRGAKIYFNGNPDLAHILDRVRDAGGEVLVKKELITPEVGYMGVFRDTEGNHIYLHSDA
jgi:predicted enzyme related to lactoylglutathione lyase